MSDQDSQNEVSSPDLRCSGYLASPETDTGTSNNADTASSSGASQPRPSSSASEMNVSAGFTANYISNLLDSSHTGQLSNPDPATVPLLSADNGYNSPSSPGVRLSMCEAVAKLRSMSPLSSSGDSNSPQPPSSAQPSSPGYEFQRIHSSPPRLALPDFGTFNGDWLLAAMEGSRSWESLDESQRDYIRNLHEIIVLEGQIENLVQYQQGVQAQMAVVARARDAVLAEIEENEATGAAKVAEAVEPAVGLGDDQPIVEDNQDEDWEEIDDGAVHGLGFAVPYGEDATANQPLPPVGVSRGANSAREATRRSETPPPTYQEATSGNFNISLAAIPPVDENGTPSDEEPAPETAAPPLETVTRDASPQRIHADITRESDRELDQVPGLPFELPAWYPSDILGYEDCFRTRPLTDHAASSMGEGDNRPDPPANESAPSRSRWGLVPGAPLHPFYLGGEDDLEMPPDPVLPGSHPDEAARLVNLRDRPRRETNGSRSMTDIVSRNPSPPLYPFYLSPEDDVYEPGHSQRAIDEALRKVEEAERYSAEQQRLWRSFSRSSLRVVPKGPIPKSINPNPDANVSATGTNINGSVINGDVNGSVSNVNANSSISETNGNDSHSQAATNGSISKAVANGDTPNAKAKANGLVTKPSTTSSVTKLNANSTISKPNANNSPSQPAVKGSAPKPKANCTRSQSPEREVVVIRIPLPGAPTRPAISRTIHNAKSRSTATCAEAHPHHPFEKRFWADPTGKWGFWDDDDYADEQDCWACDHTHKRDYWDGHHADEPEQDCSCYCCEEQ
ncbi:hypothetical protein N0V88_000196 [Collariella sp. IMI 366227]|nr:hypothetical protein N0V88_000196 [Collariella sp. IMI 366227]